MVKDKYQNVLDLSEKLNLINKEIQVQGNTLHLKGITQSQYQKDLLWDEIKRIGGENPTDIEADIKVADTTAYHRHTVEKGETLGKIAKKYYGDPSKYPAIYEANKDTLKNPDTIYPDQELVIPKL